MHTVAKTLSANDTSETNAHQAGILVPKDPSILSFFPQLSKEDKNPRSHIIFEDQDGSKWEFAFIYYNNKFFGGTRNEYRLTRMTKYIRTSQLSSGDDVIFTKVNEKYQVNYERKNSVVNKAGVLKLGSNWKVIQI